MKSILQPSRVTHAATPAAAAAKAILLVVNYYVKPPYADVAVDNCSSGLASRCTPQAFSSTTHAPTYLPLLLMQQPKLRMLVERLLNTQGASRPLHVAYMFDLKRKDPAPTGYREILAQDVAAGPPGHASGTMAGPAISAAHEPGTAPGTGAGSGVWSVAAPPAAVHSDQTDVPVKLPDGISHVVLSGGNYKANDIDVGLLFSRLPAAASVFGICLGFQLLVRHALGIEALLRMPAKVVGVRGVASHFRECGAGSWPGCRRAAVFSHRFMIPESGVRQAAAAAGACIVHDKDLVLAFATADGRGAGVQFHPECTAEDWELVRQFLLHSDAWRSGGTGGED